MSRVVTRKSDQAQIWVIGAAVERARHLVLWLPHADMLPGGRWRDGLTLNATEAPVFEAAHTEKRKLPCGHWRSSTALTTTCHTCWSRKRPMQTPRCRGSNIRHRWEDTDDGGAVAAPNARCAWCGLAGRLDKQRRLLWHVDPRSGATIKAKRPLP